MHFALHPYKNRKLQMIRHNLLLRVVMIHIVPTCNKKNIKAFLILFVVILLLESRGARVLLESTI